MVTIQHFHNYRLVDCSEFADMEDAEWAFIDYRREFARIAGSFDDQFKGSITPTDIEWTNKHGQEHYKIVQQ